MIGSLAVFICPKGHRLGRAFIALLMSVFGALAPSAFGELLSNPSFGDVDGNGSVGDGWNSYGATGFHNFFGGDPHASFFSDQPSNTGGVYQTGIVGAAGIAYRFELSTVRIEENADADFLFGIEYYGGDDATRIGGALVPMSLAVTGDGLTFSMSDVAPAGTVYVRPVVRFENVRSTASQQENVFVFQASLTGDSVPAPDPEDVQVWLTRGDRVSLLESRPDLAFDAGGGVHTVKIAVDGGVSYQTIDGFGASITDTSAWLIQNELNAIQRDALLAELFAVETGLGMSMLRVPMGASDFALSAYTYDDMPAGQTDLNLVDFSIAHDEAYIIPTLLAAMATGEDVKVVASPWSPPAWMKNTQTLWGGSLLSQYYGVYADYFVRFIQDYAAAGVPVYAVTTQNEPLNDTTAMPAATMQTYQQSAFVGSHLGPAFASAGIDTKILAFDHNWSDWSYPVVVMNDPVAGQYAAGAAFHGYGGDVSQQSNFHSNHPDAEIYFTEITGGEWATDFADNLVWGSRVIVIGTVRHWSRCAIFWNMALDQNHGPRIGGCDNCRGVVTINTNSGAVTREVEYYIIGHASKFVRPGALRIDSTSVADVIETVAFENPDGSKVLLAVNPQNSTRWFDVLVGGSHFSYGLPGKSVVTFQWDFPVPECIVDADCDDGLYCTGVETCLGESCQAGAPVVCDDGIDCTVDACDEVGDACSHVPDDGACDNGAYCDGAETCVAGIGCQSGAAPCGGMWCAESADACRAYGTGDFDADADVDLNDFHAFQVCFGGSADATPACAAGNLTGLDGSIDLADHALFTTALDTHGPQ